MNTAGGDLSQVTSVPNGVAGSFDWSPDGTKIAFASQVFTGPNCTRIAIFTISVDGSALTQITTGNDQDEGPTWSPGRRAHCIPPIGVRRSRLGAGG